MIFTLLQCAIIADALRFTRRYYAFAEIFYKMLLPQRLMMPLLRRHIDYCHTRLRCFCCAMLPALR